MAKRKPEKLRWTEPKHYPVSERKPKSEPTQRKQPYTQKLPFEQLGNNKVKDKDGRVWVHVLSANKTEAERLALFYKRSETEYKSVKNGDTYEIFKRR